MNQEVLNDILDIARLINNAISMSRLPVELLEEAAKGLLEMHGGVGGWKDASTESPPKDVEVLVCTQSKNGSRNIDKGYFDGMRYVRRGCAEVTHWMPLPELPGEGR